MRWVRSWPADPPPGRAHVVDRLERLVIDDYDYSALGELGEDVIVIEWDVAIDPYDAAAFEQACTTAGYTTGVLVAPYLLHDDAGVRWAHRRLVGVGVERWVTLGEEYCDLFGFGLVYLPRWIVESFLEAPAPERGRPYYAKPGSYTDCRFTDQTFSTWHHRKFGGVPILWDVHPAHLH